MTYSLKALADDIRTTLREHPGDEGPGAACQFVERALKDQTFVDTHFGPEKTGPRHIIHEDPELGFCICVHVYPDAKNGEPHDHGPSWAIYGQAVGETLMTHWRTVRPARDEEPALVEEVESLVLKPGMAHFYRVGDVHAPNRSGLVKLLRIEGANLDTIVRTKIEPVGMSAG